MLSRLQINGLRDIRIDLQLDRPDGPTTRLLLGGAVGSGKSTVIDGVRYIFGWPTRIGSTDLKRLSSTGSWSVSATIAGTTYTAGFKRSSVWAINHETVAEGTFKAAIGSLVRSDDVSDMATLLATSGRKRSEMFSALIQTPTTSLEEIVPAFSNWWNKAGSLPIHVAEKLPINAIIAQLKDAVNASRAVVKNAQQAMAATTSTMSAIETTAESMVDIERRKNENLEAAGALERDLEEARRLATQIEDHNNRIAAIEAQAKKIGDLPPIEPLTQAVINAKADHDVAAEALKQAVDSPPPVQSAVDPSAVDPLVARITADDDDELHRFGMSLRGAGHATSADAIRAIVLGWLEDQRRRLSDEIAALQAAKADYEARVKSLRDAKALAEAALAEAIKQEADVHTKSRTKSAADDRITALREAVSSMAIRIDVDACTTKLANLRQSITADSAMISAKRQSQQAEEAATRHRASIAIEQNRLAKLQELAAKCEEYRQATLLKSGGDLMSRINAQLTAIMGATAEIKAITGGVDAVLTRPVRGGHGNERISIDDLSDGEIVMFGAALLPVLQRGSKRVLTLNCEALDGPSMQRLLAAPLEADLVVVANNRATEAPDGWTYINMDHARGA